MLLAGTLYGHEDLNNPEHEHIGGNATLVLPTGWSIGLTGPNTYLFRSGPDNITGTIFYQPIAGEEKTVNSVDPDALNAILTPLLGTREYDMIISLANSGLPTESIGVPQFEFGPDTDSNFYVAYRRNTIVTTNFSLLFNLKVEQYIYFDGSSLWTISVQTNLDFVSPSEETAYTSLIDSMAASTIVFPLIDSDGDGLTNFDEAIFYGSNPFTKDTNFDGFEDGDIVDLGGSPNWDIDPLVEYIKTNPNVFNVFTQTELTAAETIARSLGRTDVTSSPSSFGLFTPSDVSTAILAARALINVSARVSLAAEEKLIPGFVILGESKKLLIRAVGPKLADLGVQSPLPDPTMKIFRTRFDGEPPDEIATIDDWNAEGADVVALNAAMASAGAFPLEPTENFQGNPLPTDDSKSAAALVTLSLGVYTVVVTSADGGEGEVLVEVYEITE